MVVSLSSRLESKEEEEEQDLAHLPPSDGVRGCRAQHVDVHLQGYLAHKKMPTPLGPPTDPRHRPTVGSYGGAFSDARGTPVQEGKCKAAWERELNLPLREAGPHRCICAVRLLQ